jgi:beta-glucanase (GH16 family)
MKADPSPWVVPIGCGGFGVPTNPVYSENKVNKRILENFKTLDSNTWLLRNDTFPGNLALFTPSNFEISATGSRITACREDMGVRKYSSAALTTKDSFLFGKFEAQLKPPKAKGIITGVFLHRDSPRQEIDIEFLGNNPSKMLVNVYYNPGGEKARFDYGFRGTPVLIDLGFDATRDFHKYAIEWASDEIRWYVDEKLVYKRSNWEPTPIPHLPMKFHINLWPSIARGLVGKVNKKMLPVAVDIKTVSLFVANPKPPIIENDDIDKTVESVGW